MTDFNQSNWAKAEFSKQYVENADIYIVERRRMFDILKSFYRHYLADRPDCRMLDIGCGDGIVTSEILKTRSSITAVLIDASENMLSQARERLKGYQSIDFLKSSFQETIRNNIISDQEFDFIVSSMAIHHLATDEKKSLFKGIYRWLRSGGYFVNIDVVLAPSESLDKWYMKAWQEWMDEKKISMGIEDDPSQNIVQRYKNNDDNNPDTLDGQINALKEIGFKDVDCFYKYGIFTMFGGKK